MGIGLNLQSRGEITLQSGNPDDAPLINFNLLNHPFDRVVMLEGAREMLRYLKSPTLSAYIKENILAPQSDSEEDIIVGNPSYSGRADFLKPCRASLNQSHYQVLTPLAL